MNAAKKYICPKCGRKHNRWASHDWHVKQCREIRRAAPPMNAHKLNLKRPTPETDKNQLRFAGDGLLPKWEGAGIVSADFARILEIQRDDALALIDQLVERDQKLVPKLAEMENVLRSIAFDHHAIAFDTHRRNAKWVLGIKEESIPQVELKPASSADTP